MAKGVMCLNRPVTILADPGFLTRMGLDLPALRWDNFLLGNLLPVTIGNIIGGGLMVAAVYWFVYRRRTVQA